MSEHTPGPWEWRGKPGESELQSAHGCVLGYASYEGMWLSYQASEEGRQANARLIAAAPDLLAALEALRERGHTDATWMLAERAIAKATAHQQANMRE